MKNLLSLLFCFVSVAALFGQANIQVLSKSRNETTLRLNLGEIRKTTLSTPLGEALAIGMKGGTPMLQEGAPDLPKFSGSLMIPNSGNMAVEIVDADFKDYPNLNVAPSKGNLLRKIDPSTVPFNYGTAYARDAFFPGQLAELQQPFVMRDLRGQNLWVYPVQYNPTTKVLRVYSSITLRVYHTDGQGENERKPATERGLSKSFRQLYEKLFLNFDENYLSNARGGEEPAKMLVIAKDDFIPELGPYLRWKRQMGIHTTVVPASEVGGSPAAMYDFVKNYYTQHGISYLLLVGDETALTPMVRPGSIYSCDNCLGYMDGEDHYPEVFVGRFHASNSAQLQIMMSRNLDYEKTPLIDTLRNWCATGFASASNEGQGIGDDNQADYEHANEWKAKHLADGFERYWEFYDGNHGAISPTPGDETADKPGDPVNSQLVAVMNDPGTSLYNYTGHGWEQGLSSGNFNTNAVTNLRNHQRYPIVIAVACCAGNFTNNGDGDCLGEAMQRAGNPATGEAWGGIAGYYSSDFQSWAPPMEGQDGMNQYLVDADGITLSPDLGGMATYGNALMIAKYGQGGIDMADTWNPFCDPSTVPRTALPQTLLATHVNGVFVGTSSLVVACDVEGALVSLYWQGQTLATATVEGGWAALQFPALSDVGDLTVTATQFNHVPYQGNVTVTPSAGAFVVSQTWTLDDAGSGNNNQRADFGETIALNLTLNNLGDQLANATSATLQSNDANVTITDDNEVFGDIVAGELVEKLAAFSFLVHDDVVDGHIALFTILIEYNNGQQYETSLSITLQAPRLEVGGLQITDAQGGNGNNRLESGEVARLTINNFNVGNSDSPDAIGQLSSNSPWLTINGPLSLGPIDALTGTADAVFEVKVADDAPQVVFASLEYALEAGNYTAQKSFGPYTINAILETFETNNFSSYPWQMEGDKPWFTTNASAYSGSYSSRSGTITHSQRSVMSLTLDYTEPGIISFARRVSSEQDYDFLRFMVDGVEMGAWSGVAPWGEISYPLSTGVHTLSWVYQKDELVSAGVDRAWVDEISFPPHAVLVSTSNLEQADFQATLSPNPTLDKVWLRGELPKAQDLDVVVFNNLGQQVRVYPSAGNRVHGAFSMELDLSDLSTGVYFLHLRGESGKQVLKVVKD